MATPKVQELKNWQKENYNTALDSFINNCKSQKAQRIYMDLCKEAKETHDAKIFFENNFEPKEIKGDSDGLLTGYYEPFLRGSLEKKPPYIYPIYEKPKDLITVELQSIYPQLKNYRLRGRVVDGKLIPYFSREQSKKNTLNAKVICYVDSKIERFFLEVQGSGRIILDNSDIIFVGYSDQNGYRYSSIGKYLIDIKAIKREDISLQSIREWLENHPQRVDEVLNQNRSMVFFEKRQHGASGALGLVLTPKRSIAVDPRYISLGSMVYVDTVVDSKPFDHIVMAQDTGGAIKGKARADLFLGATKDAMRVAGELKSPLKLWVLLPKKKSMDE